MKAFYETNNRWPGLKKIFKYIWNPEYNDPENPYNDSEDGASVGNPEISLSQTSFDKEELQKISEESDYSTESSTEDEGGEDYNVMKKSIKRSVADIMLSAGQEDFARHRAGTVKRGVTNRAHDLKDIISPFAVCGGHRVGSLRQIFNPVKAKKKSSLRSVQTSEKRSSDALKVSLIFLI